MDKVSEYLALEELLAARSNSLVDSITEFIASDQAADRGSRGAFIGKKSRQARIVRKLRRSLRRKHRTISLGATETGVAVYGWLTSESGFGQGARSFVDVFKSAKTPVSAHNVEIATFDNTVPFDASVNPVSNFDTLLFVFPPHWLMQQIHELPLAATIGRRRIGFWPWELPVFPARWARAFDLVHEVWVPSSFTARAVAAATDLPVRVVPHPIKLPSIDKAKARKRCKLPQDAFLFLTAFDLNSFPNRKNPVGALKAFLDAFPGSGPSAPRFVLKCHGKGHRSNPVFKELVRLASDPRVILIDAVYTPTEMRMLQAACDSFVSLHKSEGFGLNLAECMGFGKPCIATGFSGNLDFMTQRNSVLIPYRMQRLEPSDYIRGSGQWWANPLHEAAVEAMRTVAAGGFAMKTLAATAQEDIARELSTRAVGAIAREALRGESAPFSS